MFQPFSNDGHLWSACLTQFLKISNQGPFRPSLIKIGSVVSDMSKVNISIFSNGDHIWTWAGLLDTILKDDQSRPILARVDSNCQGGFRGDVESIKVCGRANDGNSSHGQSIFQSVVSYQSVILLFWNSISIFKNLLWTSNWLAKLLLGVPEIVPSLF